MRLCVVYKRTASIYRGGSHEYEQSAYSHYFQLDKSELRWKILELQAFRDCPASVDRPDLSGTWNVDYRKAGVVERDTTVRNISAAKKLRLYVIDFGN